MEFERLSNESLLSITFLSCNEMLLILETRNLFDRLNRTQHDIEVKEEMNQKYFQNLIASRYSVEEVTEILA